MKHNIQVGTDLSAEGAFFRVYAPKCQSVSVIWEKRKVTASLNNFLEPEKNGYFSAFIKDVSAGDQYWLKLNDTKELVPDPASKYQPQGSLGPSEIVDSTLFKWSDQAWEGMNKSEFVIYEMHVGTFSKEGTWLAAIEHLSDLKDLGITCIELMPIAEIPGRFGWGYDGVNLFAPTRNYGKPDDLKKFIDTAHSMNVSVILDVVYNHLGPVGNNIKLFCDNFFSDKYGTDWGEALNFDGDGKEFTREFVLSNACYWIKDFHFDGFRIDATQNIYDASDNHILKELALRARAVGNNRKIHIIAENEPQNVQVIDEADKKGFGFDAMWNDDFHHSVKVALSGRKEGYLSDYNGSVQEILNCQKWNFLFQGQVYSWQEKRRGTPALDKASGCFVHYIDNHDQVANFNMGKRAHLLTYHQNLKALTAALILGPQIPLIFQGQEFEASTCFHYFSDFDGEIGSAIAKSRRSEISQFPSQAQKEILASMPNPGSVETFESSKLEHAEKSNGRHAQMLALHRDLINIRQKDLAVIAARAEGLFEGSCIKENILILRFFVNADRRYNLNDSILILNLGATYSPESLSESLLGAPMGSKWETIWSSEDLKYGGTGLRQLESKSDSGQIRWVIPKHSAHFLKLCRLSQEEQSQEKKQHEDHEAKKKEKRSLVT